MTKLQAWHNDVSLKTKMLQKAKEHREADEYSKGTYGRYEEGEFKACSVGCSVRDLDPERNIEHLGDHEYLAEQLGVPLFITKIQDTIFERLSEGESMKWTERLFEAIPVGADLTSVMPRFLLSLMKRNIQNFDKEEDTEAYSAIEAVIKVLSDWVDAGSVDQEAANAAYAAANAAYAATRAANAANKAAYVVNAAYVAKAAANAANDANDAYAAEAAAHVAARTAYAAEVAAYAAYVAARAANAAANYADNTAYAADAAEAAARAAANIEYKWMADELISLIKDSE